jgi:hypothetical protein
VARNWDGVPRKVIAEAPALALAFGVDAPASARTGQAQQQTGEPQPRLIQILRDQHRDIEAAPLQLDEALQWLAAQRPSVKPVGPMHFDVALHGSLGFGRRELAKRQHDHRHASASP